MILIFFYYYGYTLVLSISLSINNNTVTALNLFTLLRIPISHILLFNNFMKSVGILLSIIFVFIFIERKSNILYKSSSLNLSNLCLNLIANVFISLYIYSFILILLCSLCIYLPIW